MNNIRSNAKVLKRNFATLRLSANTNQFDAHTLKNEVRSLCKKYRVETGQLYFAELLASHNTEDKFRGFLGLRSHREYLFSKLSCFMLIQHMFHQDEDLRAAVTDTISRFLPHPEVGLIPPKEIREYVESELFGIW